EAKLLLVGIPVLIWTLLPVYHMVLFAISPKDSAFAGNLWPDHPTLRNFSIVFSEQHHYLSHFWLQLWNSLLIAVSVGLLTQLFRLVYMPLMMPSLVAIGTYSLLLAWNEYLYAFLLLSNDKQITLGVALGNLLAADDSPWELLMTVGVIYALPPAAIYYTFKR